MSRPHGEIHLALLSAWRTHGPATTRDVALRAQIRVQDAHRTASRMVQAGDAVVVRSGRPALLGLPEHAPTPVRQQCVPSIFSVWELAMPP